MATDIQTSDAVLFKQFGSVKDQLQTHISKQDKDSNLYSHMSKLMDHIVFHCPNDALNKLEEISYLLKHPDTVQMQEFLRVNTNVYYNKPSDEGTKQMSAGFIDSAKKFF